MDPITLALLGGSVASTLGGIIGQNSANNEAQANIQKALEQYLAINVPDPEQQKIELQHYQSTGQLSPQLEHQIKADPSAFDQIVKNQRYSQAQDSALSQLQSLGEEGGLNLSDKANIQQQLLQNANKDKANRDAINDEMARRGQLGSGFALQTQLQGSQAAGDRDAQSRLQVLAGAQGRGLQAIMGAGDLAGKLQGQDYQRQSDLASARDRINQFNTQNAQSVQQRNVSSQNAAQAANLENEQHLSNANTDLVNKQDQYNKQLYQQQFNNEMQLANGKAGAYGSAANSAKQSGATTAAALGAVGSAAGQLGSTLQSQSNWDKWLETYNKKNQ